MNDKVRNALYHAWSQTPEGKENERTYNASYYKLHRNKIIQNVLDRRKKRKESGISLFDSIVTSLDDAYSARLAKNRASSKLSPMEKIDYRYGGEKVYDVVHTMTEAGKWVINRFEKTLIRDTGDTYKQGFEWLKKHW